MAEETSDFVERFNREGGPIPAANPDHIKMMWNRTREAERMLDPGKTSGLSAVAVGAPMLGDAPRDALAVLTIRLGLLRSLLERDVLRDMYTATKFLTKSSQRPLTSRVTKRSSAKPCFN